MYCKVLLTYISFSDPYYFDTDPDPDPGSEKIRYGSSSRSKQKMIQYTGKSKKNLILKNAPFTWLVLKASFGALNSKNVYCLMFNAPYFISHNGKYLCNSAKVT